jgi:hypothetical protein
VQIFEPPPGVVQETIDPQTGELATTSCPQTDQEYFIAGSEPTQFCALHGGTLAQSSPASWLAHLFGRSSNPSAPPAVAGANGPASATNQPGKTRGKTGSAEAPGQTPPGQEPEKKKGLLERIFGIFGGTNKPADDHKPQP